MPVAGPTLFALASALSYGAGDFIGGRAATRLPTLATLLIAQLAACALAIVVASGLGIGAVPPSAMLLGAIAGLSHVAAVGRFGQPPSPPGSLVSSRQPPVAGRTRAKGEQLSAAW